MNSGIENDQQGAYKWITRNKFSKPVMYSHNLSISKTPFSDAQCPMKYVSHSLNLMNIYNTSIYLSSAVEKENIKRHTSNVNNNVCSHLLTDPKSFRISEMENASDIQPHFIPPVPKKRDSSGTCENVQTSESVKINVKNSNIQTLLKCSSTDVIADCKENNQNAEQAQNCVVNFRNNVTASIVQGQLAETSKNYVHESLSTEVKFDHQEYVPFVSQNNTKVSVLRKHSVETKYEISAPDTSNVGRTFQYSSSTPKRSEEKQVINEQMQNFLHVNNELASGCSAAQINRITDLQKINTNLSSDSVFSLSYCKPNIHKIKRPHSKSMELKYFSCRTKPSLGFKFSKKLLQKICLNTTKVSKKNYPRLPRTERLLINKQMLNFHKSKHLNVIEVNENEAIGFHLSHSTKLNKSKLSLLENIKKKIESSERKMPQLIPLIPVALDMQQVEEDNSENDDIEEVIDIPKSPEMPTLIPFTSESEDPPQFKAQCKLEDKVSSHIAKILPRTFLSKETFLEDLSHNTSDQNNNVNEITSNSTGFEKNGEFSSSFNNVEQQQQISLTGNKQKYYNCNLKNSTWHDNKTFLQPRVVLERISLSRLKPFYGGSIHNTEDKVSSVTKITDSSKCIKDENLIEAVESKDPNVDVIDGIQFFSFLSKKDMEEFSEKHGGTFSFAVKFEGFDNEDLYLEQKGMIVPTKTNDITQIKGWRNKYFAPEVHFATLKENDTDLLNYNSKTSIEANGVITSCDQPSFDVSVVSLVSEKNERRLLSDVSCGATPEILKLLQDKIKIKNTRPAFISDTLEDFLKYKSKLKVSLLEKINPNISPLPATASILSIGNLRKSDSTLELPFPMRHKRNALHKRALIHRIQHEEKISLCDSATETNMQSSSFNKDSKLSPVNEDSSTQNIALSERLHFKRKSTDSLKVNNKFKRLKCEQLKSKTQNSQRLILRLKKEGNGSCEGYKVTNMCNASLKNCKYETEDCKTGFEAECCKQECNNEINTDENNVLPLIRQTLFSNKCDQKKLTEFLCKLRLCGGMKSEFEAMVIKSNQAYFNCPVVSEHRASKAVTAVSTVQSLLQKRKQQALQISAKAISSVKNVTNQSITIGDKKLNMPLTESKGNFPESNSLKPFNTTVYTTVHIRNTDLIDKNPAAFDINSQETRTKRSIRLPARYLDSALLVAGSEWVSPITSAMEEETHKNYKRRKIETSEQMISQNNKTQYPDKGGDKVFDAVQNSDGSLSVSSDFYQDKFFVVSSDDLELTNFNVCSLGSCARTSEYTAFSKKLYCRCTLQQRSEADLFGNNTSVKESTNSLKIMYPNTSFSELVSDIPKNMVNECNSNNVSLFVDGSESVKSKKSDILPCERSVIRSEMNSLKSVVTVEKRRLINVNPSDYFENTKENVTSDISNDIIEPLGTVFSKVESSELKGSEIPEIHSIMPNTVVSNNISHMLQESANQQILNEQKTEQSTSKLKQSDIYVGKKHFQKPNSYCKKLEATNQNVHILSSASPIWKDSKTEADKRIIGHAQSLVISPAKDNHSQNLQTVNMQTGSKLVSLLLLPVKSPIQSKQNYTAMQNQTCNSSRLQAAKANSVIPSASETLSSTIKAYTLTQGADSHKLAVESAVSPYFSREIPNSNSNLKTPFVIRRLSTDNSVFPANTMNSLVSNISVSKDSKVKTLDNTVTVPSFISAENIQKFPVSSIISDASKSNISASPTSQIIDNSNAVFYALSPDKLKNNGNILSHMESLKLSPSEDSAKKYSNVDNFSYDSKDTYSASTNCLNTKLAVKRSLFSPKNNIPHASVGQLHKKNLLPKISEINSEIHNTYPISLELKKSKCPNVQLTAVKVGDKFVLYPPVLQKGIGLKVSKPYLTTPPANAVLSPESVGNIIPLTKKISDGNESKIVVRNQSCVKSGRSSGPTVVTVSPSSRKEEISLTTSIKQANLGLGSKMSITRSLLMGELQVPTKSDDSKTDVSTASVSANKEISDYFKLPTFGHFPPHILESHQKTRLGSNLNVLPERKMGNESILGKRHTTNVNDNILEQTRTDVISHFSDPETTNKIKISSISTPNDNSIVHKNISDEMPLIDIETIETGHNALLELRKEVESCDIHEDCAVHDHNINQKNNAGDHKSCSSCVYENSFNSDFNISKEITDSGSSDEGELTLELSGTPAKVAKERDRRLRITRSLEILRSSSEIFKGKTSLNSVLKVARKGIIRLRKRSTVLRIAIQRLLLYRSQMLNRYKKLVLGMPAEVRKNMVRNLIDKIRSEVHLRKNRDFPESPFLSIVPSTDKGNAKSIKFSEMQTNQSEARTSPPLIDLTELNNCNSTDTAEKCDTIHPKSPNVFREKSEFSCVGNDFLNQESVQETPNVLQKSTRDYPGIIRLTNSPLVKQQLERTRRNLSVGPLVYPSTIAVQSENLSCTSELATSNCNVYSGRTSQSEAVFDPALSHMSSTSQESRVCGDHSRVSNDTIILPLAEQSNCSPNSQHRDLLVRSMAQTNHENIPRPYKIIDGRSDVTNMAENGKLNQAMATAYQLFGPCFIRKVRLKNGKIVYAYKQRTPSKSDAAHVDKVGSLRQVTPSCSLDSSMSAQTNALQSVLSTIDQLSRPSLCPEQTSISESTEVVSSQDLYCSNEMEEITVEDSDDEEVGHSKSSNDDTTVWISADTGEPCIVTRILSDDETEDFAESELSTKELPTIVSCSTISEEEFFRNLEDKMPKQIDV